MPCKHTKTPLEVYEETHSAKALILTCMDYRFIESAIFYLESGSLARKYDITALAGASLGYNQKKFKHWGKTFRDHVKLAIELHHIEEIVVFDHMDCGAYKLLYPDLGDDPREEKNLHKKNLKKFCKKIKEEFPDLECRGYLISLRGSIKKIV